MTTPAGPEAPPPRAGDSVDEVVVLARALGAPPRAYAILGEGNVSACDDGTTFLVKASGAAMAAAEPSSFVRVDVGHVLALVHAPPDGDEAVATVLGAARVGGATGRPSVETGMHAVLLAEAGARWVAHTHPTPITALLCSARADALVAGTLFPDQVVVCGPHPLFLPYVDPGIPLARALSAALDAHRDAFGATPKAVYLQNHGFVALGRTAGEVLAITDMAVKAARVLAVTLTCGGPRYLAPDAVRRIAGRSDEHYRQRALGLAHDAPDEEAGGPGRDRQDGHGRGGAARP